MAELITCKMGLQISYGNSIKIPQPGYLWRNEKKIAGIIRDLCRQKGIELHEGHAMSDHIRIHRDFLKTKKMTGLSFWARGYCVSTIGFDEETIKKYIRNQDKHDE